MTKIIGILRPFDMKQSFYVYDGGNKLDFAKITIDEIPNTILVFADKYKVQKIKLHGNEKYAKGIIKQIQNAEMHKYNKNTLEFEYI